MKKFKLVYIFLLIVLLVGCKKNTGEKELKHPDKSPESLSDLSSGIDEIGKSLDKIERVYMNLEPSEEGKDDELSETSDFKSGGQSGESESGQQDDQRGKGQEGNSQQENSQASSGGENKQAPMSEEEKKNQKVKEAWMGIEKKIEEIHKSWNEYIVEAQKKGITSEQLNAFESALNKMTLSIEKKDVLASYNEISQCFLTLNPVFNVYLDDIMGELSILKSDVYKSYAMGIDTSEEFSFQILENNEDIYNRIRHKLDDESKNDLITKLENSIESFKKGLVDKSRRLNMINKNIVLDNISELED